MEDLSLLEAAGVPIGAPRPVRSIPDPDALRATLEELSRTRIPEELKEPLRAWLRGYRHHWPEEFVTTLGSAGAALLEVLEAEESDPNRYLKLRRIAIANLAAARLLAPD